MREAGLLSSGRDSALGRICLWSPGRWMGARGRAGSRGLPQAIESHWTLGSLQGPTRSTAYATNASPLIPKPSAPATSRRMPLETLRMYTESSPASISASPSPDGSGWRLKAYLSSRLGLAGGGCLGVRAALITHGDIAADVRNLNGCPAQDERVHAVKRGLGLDGIRRGAGRAGAVLSARPVEVQLPSLRPVR